MAKQSRCDWRKNKFYFNYVLKIFIYSILIWYGGGCDPAFIVFNEIKCFGFLNPFQTVIKVHRCLFLFSYLKIEQVMNQSCITGLIVQFLVIKKCEFECGCVFRSVLFWVAKISHNNVLTLNLNTSFIQHLFSNTRYSSRHGTCALNTNFLAPNFSLLYIGTYSHLHQHFYSLSLHLFRVYC